MASAANDFVNLIITGDEGPQMDGQDDPVQEERQEEMYTHVFEGQWSWISPVARIMKREHMTEATSRDDEDCVVQRRAPVQRR